jgi:hypothetical protein
VQVKKKKNININKKKIYENIWKYKKYKFN